MTGLEGPLLSAPKQGDNVLGLSVHPSVDTLTPEPFDLRPKTITSLRCFSVSVNLRVFTANFADAVDQLLICEGDLV